MAEKVDSYTSAGRNSGTSFVLSDHEIPVVMGAGVDSMTAEFQKLEVGTEAAAAVPDRIPRPDFVDAGGTINTTGLRVFLVDVSNRMSQKFVPGNQPNLLSEQALIPVVAWVTGIAPQPGQTVESYFDQVSPENSILEMVKIQGDQFAEDLLEGLRALATKGAEGALADSGMTLAQMIRRDPINTCKVMIDAISPQESIGALQLGPALLAFRSVCLAPGQ